MTMHGAEGGISEPQRPPYPIGMAQERQEAVGQIYDQVNGKEPPSHNIASEALQAYYTRVNPQTLNTWACQILCMISEYHMACMTRGAPVTSPIVPGELEALPTSGSGMQRSFYQLCKVLFTNYAKCLKLVYSSSYAGSRLHLLSEGCALVWGMFVRGCACRDLC